MKHDDPNSKGSYTYSDAMNEWAGEQDSFFRRARTGILHPSAASSGFYRLLGYAWRLLLVAAVALVIAYVGVRKYLKTSEFSESIATQVTTLLDAKKTEIRPFRWKSANCVSAEFSSTGSPTSFYSSLRGTYLQFERPLLSLFSPTWHLDEIRIDNLTLNLRSGGIGTVPDLPSTSLDDLPEFPSDFKEPETQIDIDPDAIGDDIEPLGMDLRIKSSGYGINPDFGQLTFGSININKLDATWGLTPVTRGSLTDAAATVTGQDGNWTITASTGTLDQRWLQQMNLTSPLTVTYNDGTLTFSPCQLAFPSAGTAKLAGQIKTGAIPTLDFDLSITSTPAEALLAGHPEALNIVSGTLTGSGKVTGSTNTGDGVAVTLSTTLKNGHLAYVPLLGALASQTGYSSLRQLPVSGTLDIATTASTTTFSNIDLTSAESVRVRGSFTVTTHDADPKPEDYPEGIPYTPAPPTYAGTLQLGLTPELLSRHTAARDRLFKPDAGFLWIDVPLDGPLRTLTNAQTDDLLEAFRH